MKNKYLVKLSELEEYEKHLLRQINVYCYDKEKKDYLFTELKKTKNEIKATKFTLNMERKLKNANNNTDKSSN